MTARSCETCIYRAMRTFAGRDEARCFYTYDQVRRDSGQGIGWSLVAETHQDNFMGLAHRCGPDRDWYEAKQ